MLTRELALPDPAATGALAAALARALPENPAGWLILLEGELGSGKSTFARAMLRSLGHDGPVPSPTYTLVEPYEFSGFDVYHIDLYRIADEGELHFLAFDELDAGLRLIEWPERIPALYATADLVVRLQYDGDGRRASLDARSDRAKQALGAPDFDQVSAIS